eukprot:Protomagalhaensia_sp_Gyna_25__5399@NODE_69_length_5656_cov_114_358910_g51_i0_p8_GENE_NODE_69_length_5656_cov_114_358910_g51_i0NODE_69_length_5656_cov_114_358910_g51_i0_p8_ORF_typecomplete_len114_score5_20_NODE_69_length_5656_cov_114_358910_g51_i047355076
MDWMDDEFEVATETDPPVFSLTGDTAEARLLRRFRRWLRRWKRWLTSLDEIWISAMYTWAWLRRRCARYDSALRFYSGRIRYQLKCQCSGKQFLESLADEPYAWWQPSFLPVS